MKRPIRPFGEDLWRDIELAVENAGQLRVSGLDEEAMRAFYVDPTPYLHHIRDRVLEHRAAELRSVEQIAKRAANLAQQGIDDALMLSQ